MDDMHPTSDISNIAKLNDDFSHGVLDSLHNNVAMFSAMKVEMAETQSKLFDQRITYLEQKAHFHETQISDALCRLIYVGDMTLKTNVTLSEVTKNMEQYALEIEKAIAPLREQISGMQNKVKDIEGHLRRIDLAIERTTKNIKHHAVGFQRLVDVYNELPNFVESKSTASSGPTR